MRRKPWVKAEVPVVKPPTQGHPVILDIFCPKDAREFLKNLEFHDGTLISLIEDIDGVEKSIDECSDQTVVDLAIGFADNLEKPTYLN